MKWLHAPWRMAYIKAAPSPAGCLFCRVPSARRDRALLLLHRGRTCFTMLNRYPYNGGHLMVAPYAHAGRLKDLSAAVRMELLDRVCEMEALLDRLLRPHGYNLGINVGRVAGQGIEGHLHVHIVPRWNGDTNFLSVVSGTRVVSESLDALYVRLRAGLKAGRRRS